MVENGDSTSPELSVIGGLLAGDRSHRVTSGCHENPSVGSML